MNIARIRKTTVDVLKLIVRINCVAIMICVMVLGMIEFGPSMSRMMQDESDLWFGSYRTWVPNSFVDFAPWYWYCWDDQHYPNRCLKSFPLLDRR